MKVGDAGLVALRLEVGEENAAVLLARSTLPDELDTELEFEPLLQFGGSTRGPVGVVGPPEILSTTSAAGGTLNDRLPGGGSVGASPDWSAVTVLSCRYRD